MQISIIDSLPRNLCSLADQAVLFLLWRFCHPDKNFQCALEGSLEWPYQTCTEIL